MGAEKEPTGGGEGTLSKVEEVVIIIHSSDRWVPTGRRMDGRWASALVPNHQLSAGQGSTLMSVQREV